MESCKSTCGIKSHSAHTDYRAFCTAVVHSARSQLGALSPTPPACTPFYQRPATSALSVPGLPFSSEPRHQKLLGTCPKVKGSGQLKLPQHGYSSAPQILSRMIPEERRTPLRYHSCHLHAHSGSSWTRVKPLPTYVLYILSNAISYILATGGRIVHRVSLA